MKIHQSHRTPTNPIENSLLKLVIATPKGEKKKEIEMTNLSGWWWKQQRQKKPTVEVTGD